MARKLVYALLLVLPLSLMVAEHAFARAEAALPYELPEAFSTALRFVRVEKNCKVTDKDPDAAFVLFECADDGKTKRGSLELFKSGHGVRAQITLGDDTHGMELRWLELFERKLRDERGTPIPPAPEKEKEAPARDAGT